MFVCPENSWTSFPVLAFQIRAAPPLDGTRMVFPSGVIFSFHVNPLSYDAVRTSFPSGLNCAEVKKPRVFFSMVQTSFPVVVSQTFTWLPVSTISTNLRLSGLKFTDRMLGEPKV